MCSACNWLLRRQRKGLLLGPHCWQVWLAVSIHRYRRHVRLMFVLLLISVLSGRSAIEAWISHHVTHNQTPSPTVSVIQPQPTPTQPSLIDNTATLFMGAMIHKNWTSMWLMLSPDAQQLWQG